MSGSSHKHSAGQIRIARVAVAVSWRKTTSSNAAAAKGNAPSSNKPMLKADAKANKPAKASSRRKINHNGASSKRVRDNEATNRVNKLNQANKGRTVNKVKAANKASNRANAGKVRANSKLPRQINNQVEIIPARRKKVSKGSVAVTGRTVDNAVEVFLTNSVAMTVAVGPVVRSLVRNTRNGLIVCATLKRCWTFPSCAPRPRGCRCAMYAVPPSRSPTGAEGSRMS